MNEDSIQTIKRRLDGIRESLPDEMAACSHDQRHLDAGTTERAYWHYGYAMALKDVLSLLRGWRFNG
jgi:hypothetical protein